MGDALTNGFASLPDQLCRSFTWDRGKELSAHAEFTVTTGIPCSSLTRTAHGNASRTRTVTLNSRPRKVLGWRTPAEALDDHLRSLEQAGGASTN